MTETLKRNLRKTEDQFVYTRLGEQISDKAIMAYLGLDKLPKCVVTDDITDPMPAPADFNQQNLLPSNMVYYSKRMLMAKGVTTHAMAEFETEQGFAVTLYLPHFWEAKAIEKAGELLEQLEENKPAENENTVEWLYGVWDYLMFYGAKGLHTLSYRDQYNVKYSIDAHNAISKLFEKFAKRSQTADALMSKPAPSRPSLIVP